MIYPASPFYQLRKVLRLLIGVLVILIFLRFTNLYLRDLYWLSEVPARVQHLSTSVRHSNIPGPRIGKVSVVTNFLDSPTIHRALRTHEVQNAIHGYPHFIATHETVMDFVDNSPAGRGRGMWTKPAFLLSVIVAELEKPAAERLKWIFWFDADTVVINPHTPLEIFLPPESYPDLEEVSMILASNWDGLNTGAFGLRIHPWSVSLLSAVLAYPIYEAERRSKDRFKDQSAFQFLLQSKDSPLKITEKGGKRQWMEVPMRWFNSLPFNNAFTKKGEWILGGNMTSELFDNGTTTVYEDGRGPFVQPWKVMQGDMLVHFAGASAGRSKDSWMTPWLNRAESSLPNWSNATKKLDLQVEAEKFWMNEAVKLGVEREKAALAKTMAKVTDEKKKPDSQVDKNKDTKPADKKETKPADDKKETKPADDKTETKPADDKKGTKPVDDKKETKPADDKKDTKLAKTGT